MIIIGYGVRLFFCFVLRICVFVMVGKEACVFFFGKEAKIYLYTRWKRAPCDDGKDMTFE